LKNDKYSIKCLAAFAGKYLFRNCEQAELERKSGGIVDSGKRSEW